MHLPLSVKVRKEGSWSTPLAGNPGSSKQSPTLSQQAKNWPTPLEDDANNVNPSAKRMKTRVVDQGIRHEAEPELGGTADGTASGLDATPDPLVNRVDRLRLLGNGMVNQTAAKAFSALSVRLAKDLK